MGTRNTNYFQQVTLESWYTILQQTPLNRHRQQVPVSYKRLIHAVNETDKRDSNGFDGSKPTNDRPINLFNLVPKIIYCHKHLQVSLATRFGRTHVDKVKFGDETFLERIGKKTTLYSVIGANLEYLN